MIQMQVINYILETKDSSLITLNNLNEEYFSDYKNEFNFIKNHLNQYGKIPDKETFYSKFDSFPNIKVDESPEYLIKELYNDRNTRFLASTFNKIRSLIQSNKIEEAMSLYSTASENLSTGVSLKSIDLLKDTSRYEAYIERMNDFDKHYIRTGFKELDNIIGGWDREDELATISARPGVGKSFILLKCATAAAQQGLNVGIYSGEMSDKMVGYRIDTLISHISNGALVHGNDSVANEYKQFLDTELKKVKGSLKVLTPAMIGGPATVTTLRAFVEREELDILFVDQHSLLEDDRKAKNPVDKASNISKDLKNLQSVKKIPIIAVSQQNRSSVENGVDSSNIAQSDRIGQDSSIIIFLEKKDDILTMYLVKSRYSEQGKKLVYRVDYNKGTFDYIPIESDNTQNTIINDKEYNIEEYSSDDIEQRYELSGNSSKDVF